MDNNAKGPGAGAQQERSENEVVRQMKEKLLRLRQEEGVDPYVVEKWDCQDRLEDIRARFESLAPEETDETVTLRTAGRLMTLRRQGKTTFADLADETGRMQLYFQVNALGEKEYDFLKKWVDCGDWVGVVGHPCRTKRGELTIQVTEHKLLSKSIRPLPEKWHGLTDTEIRYRQRYMDLIANPDVRDVFRRRSKIIASFRRTLEEHGTLEVETPILSVLAGGAAARPFKTFHNALGLSMYMRIAVELYLKRLVVGMMGRVYEIGRNFRNEGIDTMHNPEFTMMEVYWPYANYEDMMNLAEELIRNAARAIGTMEIEWDGVKVDLSKPFRRITMMDAVKEHAGVDMAAVKDDEEARRIAREKGLGGDLKGTESRFAVLNMLYEAFCEEKMVQPTFVMGHPTEISPLSKRDPQNPDYTHRFELFMFGKEVANAFSELNDPLDQRERFEDQLKKREAGDEEAHDFDEDFINAIEVGLPPTGGMGIGMDRVVMFLTGSHSIRDVILFPSMKPVDANRGTVAAPEAEPTPAPAAEEKIDFSNVRIEPLFKEEVDFDTFCKSDFRTVKVLECVAVPKSKKLLRFTLDDGTDERRTILSGIHAFYEPEELLGKTLIAITNLPPRAMMGIESCGMLLSAVHEEEGEEKLHLLMVDDHIPAGAKLH